MKNFKKLTRDEMKTVSGGEFGLWACCTLDGHCSTTVFGDSDNLYCSDHGTYLAKKGLAPISA